MVRALLVLTVIAAILAVVASTFLLRPAAGPVVAGQSPLLGDVNENGRLDFLDASSIIEAVIKDRAADLPDQADVNFDGVIDIIDAALVHQAVVGRIPGLPPDPVGTPPLVNAASIEIESVEIRPNEWRFVELWARDVDPPGLGAWFINIDFEPSVGDVRRCVGYSYARCNTDEDGRVRLAGVNAFAVAPQGDTRLAFFRFTCHDAEAVTGLTVTVLTLADFTFGAPQPIDVSTTSGTVTCSNSAPPKPTRTPFLEATPIPPTPRMKMNDLNIPPNSRFGATLRGWIPLPGITLVEILVHYPQDLLEPAGCTTDDRFTCEDEYAPGTARFVAEGETRILGNVAPGSLTFWAPNYNCSTTLNVEWDLGGPTRDGTVTIEGGPDVASGDVNCDGIGAVDALLVLQVEAGLLTSVPYPEHVDVDGDGIHTSMDATVILQYLAGLLESLPP